MRFTFVWPSAERLPMVIVAIARQPRDDGPRRSATAPLIEPLRAPSASAKKRTQHGEARRPWGRPRGTR